MRQCRISASAVILGVLLAGCATVPVTGRKQLSLVSQGELLQLGKEGYQDILSQTKVSHDQEATAP